MLYKEIAPEKDLKKIIKCFWMLEHDYREKFHTHEHLWADAHAELIFTFGKPYYLKTKTGKKVLPKNFVIGPFKKELMLYSDGFTGFVAVRFKAWGVYPFSIKPITALVNNILPAEDVFGDEIKSISNRIGKKERDEKVKLLQEYFQTAFSGQSKNRPSSIPIASKIITKKGIVKISDLTKQFAISHRQLQRIFKTETGLSPKIFARIVRFNHARQLIAANPDISLSQLTYQTGYSDQAHFSKNFREMFDISPADFKRQMKEFMQGYDENNMDVAFLQDQ
jgi:AraC-like DNA-binding protein